MGVERCEISRGSKSPTRREGLAWRALLLDLVTPVVTVCAARWVILYILPPVKGRRSKQLAITTARRHVMKYLLLPFSPSRP